MLLPMSLSLDERVWGIAQLPQAVSHGQGQEAGRLLEGSLGYRPGEAVPKPGQEQAVAIG